MSASLVNKALRQREAQAGWRARNPEAARLGLMFNNARIRARAKGLPFSITKEDIVVPAVCPVLGVPLTLPVGNSPGDTSPSLDRIIPALGYVPGNVRVISYRANRIRNDATIAELEAVLAYAKGLV